MITVSALNARHKIYNFCWSLNGTNMSCCAVPAIWHNFYRPKHDILALIKSALTTLLLSVREFHHHQLAATTTSFLTVVMITIGFGEFGNLG